MNNSVEKATFNLPTLPEKDFIHFKHFIYEVSGIHLSDAKRSLVAGRLSGRLRTLQLSSYAEYFAFATSKKNIDERTYLIDALTTNETYFFREPEHFAFLSKLLQEHKSKSSWRIWSGASSSGEEIYTIAMVMADELGFDGDWNITGTDLNTKVLKMATAGHYPLERNQGISKTQLQRYCLKGIDSQQGTFLIDPALRRHTQFSQQNLIENCSRLGLFDVIFLRNVMIYFDTASKQKVLNNVLRQLKLGGYFIISHTESLMNTQHPLTQVGPSIYRKTAV